MPTIYQYKTNGVFTGETREITEMEGIPIGWTSSVPPEVPDGYFALFSGPDWTMIDHEPGIAVAQVVEPVQPTLTELQDQLAELSAKITALAGNK
jgi:hypothetical protein